MQVKALAIRWKLGSSRKCPSQNMAFKLNSELVGAAKGSGDAIHKTHRMAETNKTKSTSLKGSLKLICYKSYIVCKKHMKY